MGLQRVNRGVVRRGEDSDQRSGGRDVSPGDCEKTRVIMGSVKWEGGLRLPGDSREGQEEGAGT